MNPFEKKVYTPYQQKIFGGKYRRRRPGKGGRLVLHRTRHKPIRNPLVARKMAMIRATSPQGRKRIDWKAIK